MPREAAVHKCSICEAQMKSFIRVSADSQQNLSQSSVNLHGALLSLFGQFPDSRDLTFCQVHSRSVVRLADRARKVICCGFVLLFPGNSHVFFRGRNITTRVVFNARKSMREFPGKIPLFKTREHSKARVFPCLENGQWQRM